MLKHEGWSRRFSEDQLVEKRPRRYYYRLESESSRASEEDTESVYSLQDRETDVVRDTTDTESRLDSSEYDVEIEYEVASLSEGEHDFFGTSSGPDEDIVTLAAVAAAGAICHSSCDTASWVTDGEDSDTSSLGDISLTHKDFSICMQCKTANKNPLFAFCEKCYQDRKRFLPPRPRRKKRSTKQITTRVLPVKLDTLRSCLSGLSSQDSGIGSSQECPQLDLDQIVVPDHLKPSSSSVSSSSSNYSKIEERPSSSKIINVTTTLTSSRKRNWSESSLSDSDIMREKSPPKIIKLNKTTSICSTSSDEIKIDNLNVNQDLIKNLNNRKRSNCSDDNNSESDTKKSKQDDISSDLCMFCNNAPKDSIFIHTNMAHNCCCYKCAIKTLNTIKRCPICNMSVSKVLKMYTI